MPMTGSPASITPSEPGSTQSGSPITSVAAQAVTPTPAVARAQSASALPIGMRPPRSAAGTAAALPLDVTVSRTRTRSLACCGRASGSLARHAMISSASAGGTSPRINRRSRGDSVMCAARSRAGVVPWKGGWPAISS